MSSQIQEKMKALNDRLVQIVMADGVISEDEQYLLDKTRLSIEKLEAYIHSNSVDDKRKEKISVLVQKIEDDALSAAEFDDFISEDEMGLLGVLFDSLGDIMKSS